MKQEMVPPPNAYQDPTYASTLPQGKRRKLRATVAHVGKGSEADTTAGGRRFLFTLHRES